MFDMLTISIKSEAFLSLGEKSLVNLKKKAEFTQLK